MTKPKPLHLDERQALILLDALTYSLKHRTDLHRTEQLTGLSLGISLSTRCKTEDLRQLLGEAD